LHARVQLELLTLNISFSVSDSPEKSCSPSVRCPDQSIIDTRQHKSHFLYFETGPAENDYSVTENEFNKAD